VLNLDTGLSQTVTRVANFRLEFPSPGAPIDGNVIVNISGIGKGRIQLSSELFTGLRGNISPSDFPNQFVMPGAIWQFSDLFAFLPTSPPDFQNTPQPAAPSGTISSANIHAIIISGLSQAEDVIFAKRPIHLTGGIIALGASTPRSRPPIWQRGLTITPDPDLLDGAKVPPITPNIVDVRIRHYSVEATMEEEPKR
jgi:hypothetical protein